MLSRLTAALAAAAIAAVPAVLASRGAAATTSTASTASTHAAPGPPPGGSSIAYLALTFDGHTLTLYVDGRRAAAHAEPGPADRGAPAMEIGAYAGQEWWNGAIDEVAVYGRALSPATIAGHYRTGTTRGSAYAGVVTRTRGIVGFWRLDDPRHISDAVGSATGSPPAKRLTPWYGLVSGSRDGALAFNGFGDEVRLRGVPALRSFTIEAWVLPGPQIANRTIVSRPGAWVLKTNILGRWNGGFFHAGRIVGVTARSGANPPHSAPATSPPATRSSGSGTGGASPVVFIVILAAVGALAASVPLRRRLGTGGKRNAPGHDPVDSDAPPPDGPDAPPPAAGEPES